MANALVRIVCISIFATASSRKAAPKSLLQVVSSKGWTSEATPEQFSDGEQENLEEKFAAEDEFAEDLSSTAPENTKPLDLWAIHDLLLAGHRAPLVPSNGGAGLAMVEAAAVKLTNMLEDIHPVASCRKAIAQKLKTIRNAEKDRSLQAVANRRAYATVAEVAWSCLNLSAKNFTDPFVSERQVRRAVDRTAPLFNESLGVCGGSGWPRVCSYWASIHAMGVRADAVGKGQEFFLAAVHLIAGGALYCVG
jgi:hypothetical protein